MQKQSFTLDFQPIPGAELKAEIGQAEQEGYDITIEGSLPCRTPIGDWQLHVRPTFEPNFFYTPHLTPTDEHVIDMHVFRTPVMMMGTEDVVLCVMPVMENVKDTENRIYMDLDANRGTMTLGITTTKVKEHVLYHRTGKAVLPAGTFVFKARVLQLKGQAAKNPFRAVLAWYWRNYGSWQSARLPSPDCLMSYVKHTYTWAFDNWKEAVWQEFNLNGKRVGAPQMIVTAYQSPNYHQPYSLRETKAIWNQAWFSSLRSAQGLYRYGMAAGNQEYVRKARLTKELALAFPQENGLFDSVIAVMPVEYRVSDGKIYTQSADWSQYYFGNSNRNPVSNHLADSPRHILDMSWTALQMLNWYCELERDERLLDYAVRYVGRLLELQDEKGYFPAWLDKKTGSVRLELRQSPEAAVSAAFLLKLYGLRKEEKYRLAALRCMDVLIKEVLPDRRWEDFETYWSCSGYGKDTLQGEKIERNACYKECSLSPFWMAMALLACWKTTGDEKYLKTGELCLDELLMFQSSFQPEYMPIPVVGGFGVMNCDAELNDARQSLFAEVILQYGEVLKDAEYIERGMAALRASFSMMYCPENPLIKTQWEMKWPWFNEKDYGFMMENYGHDGYADSHSLGIGEFTIYDWGNGAAAEAVMRIFSHGMKAAADDLAAAQRGV